MDLAPPPAAALLLPDHAELHSEPSPLGPEGPRAPASADERRRHARSLAILRNQAWSHLDELKWMTREPRLGAACLMEFLEETMDPGHKTIVQTRDEGCLYAMLQLAEWREPRAYPLILRLIQRLDCDRWNVPISDRFPFIASSLAACCDGNLALLRERILDTGTDPGSRALALGTVAYLALRRGLAPAIAQQCFRMILTTQPKPDIWMDGTILLVNLAAIDAWYLYPAALRGELEAVVRHRWVSRRNLTLKKIAERAAAPEWERDRLVYRRYALLPHNVWKLLSERQFVLSEDLEDDADDDEAWDVGDDSAGVFDADPAAAFSGLPAGGVTAGVRHRDFELPDGLPPAENARPVDFRDVGRNDPCPCGSGKKFKKCCG